MPVPSKAVWRALYWAKIFGIVPAELVQGSTFRRLQDLDWIETTYGPQPGAPLSDKGRRMARKVIVPTASLVPGSIPSAAIYKAAKDLAGLAPEYREQAISMVPLVEEAEYATGRAYRKALKKAGKLGLKQKLHRPEEK